MIPGRDDKTKQALANKVQRFLAEELQIDPKLVSVSIEDVEKAAWDVGVACQDGRMFHGLCHLRINLALPLSRVQEAFHRLDKYVFNAE